MESCQVSEFKAHCLEWVKKVHDQHQEVIITKRNVPYARVVPIEEEPYEIYGCMEGTGTILGDVISPIEEKWDACS
ncbi:MAG: type II toxin-antitoxin system Phd/YefM family antitoxin [Chlamydiia bacterium]|nr:type II toxin-antitoxin system Phd/YefM family antitoxin [Chlamydiia bacterium]